jgi:hypothetical protein
MLAGFTASLNVALTAADVGTLRESVPGQVPVTVGAIVSGSGWNTASTQ